MLFDILRRLWRLPQPAVQSQPRSRRPGLSYQLKVRQLEQRLVPSSVPAAPPLLATAVSSSQVNLVWSPVAGANDYAVAEYLNGASQQIVNVSRNTTTYAFTGLSAGATYAFQVTAANLAGMTGSNWQTVTTPYQISPPAAPSFAIQAVSSSQINLSWNPVAGASGYLVDEYLNGAWQQIANLSGSNTSYAVTRLNAGTTYNLDVAAYNAAGKTWAHHQSATTLQAAPAAPTFAIQAVSSSQINLSWNPVAGASGYLVDEYLNGAWQQIANLSSSSTSYAVTRLNAGTTYNLDVAAYNAAGKTWAHHQSATTTAAVTVDHPLAAKPYSPVSGSLFGANGPSYLDVVQGNEGDCWLLSSLAVVAAREPSVIRSMFTSKGATVENGAPVDLYSVRLYDNSGNAHYITVDTELPGGGNEYDQPNHGVLWVALAEKAYAQANGQGLVTSGHVGSDSYDALNGGWPEWALHAITGASADRISINPSDIAKDWNAGKLICLTSSIHATDPDIVGNPIEGPHVYAVVGYNPRISQPFLVFNPWGADVSQGHISPDGAVTYYSFSQENHHPVYGLFNASAAFLSHNFASQSSGAGAKADQGSLAGLPPIGRTMGLALTRNDSGASPVFNRGDATTVMAKTTQALGRPESDGFWVEAGHRDIAADLLEDSLSQFWEAIRDVGPEKAAL